MSYTTKQQQAVLRCLEQRQGEPLTAADLAQALRQEGCPVGLATIYRQLEKLTLTGQVHKMPTHCRDSRLPAWVSLPHRITCG